MAKARNSVKAAINRTTGVSTVRTRVNGGKVAPGKQSGFGTRTAKRRDLRVAFGLAGG